MFTENQTDEYFTVDGSSAFTENQTDEYLTVDGNYAFEVEMENITSVLITKKNLYINIVKKSSE